jgi:helix-turn-helix protein
MSQPKFKLSKAARKYRTEILKARSNLIRCTGIDCKFKMVLLVILDHVNYTHQAAWPSQETIAAESGLGLRTVQRVIQAARDDTWEGLAPGVGAISLITNNRHEARRLGFPIWEPEYEPPQLNVMRINLGWEGFGDAPKNAPKALPEDQRETMTSCLRIASEIL